MKTFTLFSVMCFFSMTSSHGEGEVKLSGAYGGGLHRYYDLTQWDGKEQVVSRLKKGDHVILFVRVSKEDFEVKDGEDGTQIFFRFNSRLDSMSPGLQSAFLVDFIRKNDEAAILMLGSRGYFYMRSSAVAPKVIPPKHFFPNKKLIPTEWFPRFIMPARDYYPEVPGIVSEKVIEAKLKSIREIEFTLKPVSGVVANSDVFDVGGANVMKNGKPHDSPGFSEGRELGIIDEGEFALRVLDEKMSLETLRRTIVAAGYSEKDIKNLVSRFEDSDASAKIEAKVTAAFE